MTEQIAATDQSIESGKQTMTIQEAKALYGKYSADLKQDMGSVVKVIRDSKTTLPLSNSNYLHALTFTDLMLGHTEKEFRMLTGCAGGGFLECLRGGFEQMLARLTKAGGFARIILVNGDSRGPLDDLKASYPKALEFVEATTKSDRSVHHYIISDRDMVRDEKPHEKITDTDSAEIIQADVFFNNPPKAAAMIGEFDVLWKHLHNVSAKA